MLVLEHTLIMLLLLIGVLNARPKLPRFVLWIVIGAIFLAFFPPTMPIALPWDWLAALVIPLLLWQIAHRLIGARWLASYRDLVVWILLVIGISLVISQLTDLSFASAFLFSLLIVSMAWQASEEAPTASILGMLGPLTLAFLITEIEPAIVSPGQYAISLLGGLGVGALVGYIAVHVALQITEGFRRNVFTLAQVYLAYVLGIILGVSSVAAALLSVTVYVAYGAKRGLWPSGQIQPKPLNSPFVFLSAAAALAFFAWQTHIPLAPILLLEIGLGLLVVLLAILIGTWVKSPTFTGKHFFTHILPRVALVLIAAVLLWRTDTPLDPAFLAVALVVAGLTTISAHLVLVPLLGVYRWLDELGVYDDDVEESADVLQVRDLMRREWLSIPPDMPVRQLAQLLSDRGLKYGLVIDSNQHLAGIVTEADLFIKEEHIPRTDRTYPVLFNHPVMPERLPDVYLQLAEQQTVSDIMSAMVTSVKENHSIGRAAREMVRYGIEYLPVMGQDEGDEEKLVGVITRSDILHTLMGTDQTIRTPPPG